MDPFQNIEGSFTESQVFSSQLIDGEDQKSTNDSRDGTHQKEHQDRLDSISSIFKNVSTENSLPSEPETRRLNLNTTIQGDHVSDISLSRLEIQNQIGIENKDELDNLFNLLEIGYEICKYIHSFLEGGENDAGQRLCSDYQDYFKYGPEISMVKQRFEGLALRCGSENMPISLLTPIGEWNILGSVWGDWSSVFNEIEELMGLVFHSRAIKRYTFWQVSKWKGKDINPFKMTNISEEAERQVWNRFAASHSDLVGRRI